MTTQSGHTVTTEPSSRHVVVKDASSGHVIAETTGGHVLHETGLDDRWYLPRSAVRAPLHASDTTSHCPYKGDASYWNVQLPDGTTLRDVAWSYEEPRPPAADVGGELSFWTEGIVVEVDGEPVPV